ncbi:unnamed protein product [Pleuronectes platessa]|uniref:Uncharacterized protein n=1 Tax=Pleuronectes platessa TaxID=8262 RepID=A0A9N7UVG8_PLEPL|nr:unnamed protein product [Pleuronectes platessa]
MDSKWQARVGVGAGLREVATEGEQDQEAEEQRDMTPTQVLTSGAGVRPEQTGPLRRERRRPEAVLLSRRRGGGRLPVVSPCRSFWEWCYTRNKPPSSHRPAPGSRAGVQRSGEEQRSYGGAAGLAVMDELILANIQNKRRARPHGRLSSSPCEVTPRAQIGSTRSLHTNNILKFSRGQRGDRGISAGLRLKLTARESKEVEG